MSAIVKNNNGLLAQCIVLTAIVFAVASLGDIASTYVSYPTASHRAAAKELSVLQSTRGTTQQEDVMLSKQESQLINSKELQYSATASVIAGAVAFVIYVYLVWKVYFYARKKRFTNRYRLFTIGVVTLGSMLAVAIRAPVTNAIVGYDATAGGSAVGIIIVTTLTTLFFTILIVMVAESRYKSKHSLLVD